MPFLARPVWNTKFFLKPIFFPCSSHITRSLPVGFQNPELVCLLTSLLFGDFETRALKKYHTRSSLGIRERSASSYNDIHAHQKQRKCIRITYYYFTCKLNWGVLQMNDVHFSLYITYTIPYYTYEAIPKVRTCRHQQHLRLYGQGNQGHTSSFQENTLRFLRQLDGIWIPQPHAPPLIFFSMKINVLCFLSSYLLLCNKKK